MASGIVEHKWQTHQLYASASPQISHEPFYSLYPAKGHFSHLLVTVSLRPRCHVSRTELTRYHER